MEAGRGLAPPAFTLTLCNETSVAPAPIPISIWASHCARITANVDRDDQSAKFWLDPVALARKLGFGAVELRRVHRLVVENRNLLLKKCYERFPS